MIVVVAATADVETLAPASSLAVATELSSPVVALDIVVVVVAASVVPPDDDDASAEDSEEEVVEEMSVVSLTLVGVLVAVV